MKGIGATCDGINAEGGFLAITKLPHSRVKLTYIN